MNKYGKPAPSGMALVAEILLGRDRQMLPGSSFSKTLYCIENPENDAFFDVHLCVENGHLWQGDLDFATDDGGRVQQLANELRQPVIVFLRSDTEFANPVRTIEPILEKSS